MITDMKLDLYPIDGAYDLDFFFALLSIIHFRGYNGLFLPFAIANPGPDPHHVFSTDRL